MKIVESGWDQPSFDDAGLLGKKRGRKPIGNKKLQFKTIGLTAEQWEWLEKWLPGRSPTAQARELFERARKFWPAGPNKFR